VSVTYSLTQCFWALQPPPFSQPGMFLGDVKSTICKYLGIVTAHTFSTNRNVLSATQEPVEICQQTQEWIELSTPSNFAMAEVVDHSSSRSHTLRSQLAPMSSSHNFSMAAQEDPRPNTYCQTLMYLVHGEV
jgi:hypothetical protein